MATGRGRRKRMRPTTTLLLLSSLDGKITSGVPDTYDFELDLPKALNECDGYRQFQQLRDMSSEWILSTGRAQEKRFTYVNPSLDKAEAYMVVVDNSHLRPATVRWLAAKYKTVFIATNDDASRWFSVGATNVIPIVFSSGNFTDLFQQLYSEFGCNKLCLQTGSSLNATLFENDLIDYIHLIVAPLVVGGQDVPCICGGPSLTNLGLPSLYPLTLQEVVTLRNSYIQLRYIVRHGRPT